MIAIKYDGGVLLACDTLLNYGSLAKWPNIPRIKIIGSHTAMAASGDYADFQNVTRTLEQHLLEESLAGDGMELTTEELFCYLHRTMYDKRCEFEPALCQFVVIGSDKDGKTTLGVVDDIGTRWTDRCAATGYGAHMTNPQLRAALDRKPNLTRDEAVELLKDCLRVQFYRECRAINKFQIADAANGKITISEPFSVDTNWGFEGFSFEKTAIIR